MSYVDLCNLNLPIDPLISVSNLQINLQAYPMANPRV